MVASFFLILNFRPQYQIFICKFKNGVLFFNALGDLSIRYLYYINKSIQRRKTEVYEEKKEMN